MEQAIKNALEDIAQDPSADAVVVMERHVRDFLAQKFAATMIKTDSEEVTELWQKITTKEAA